MYELLKGLLLPILQLPAGAPQPPPGHTDPASLKTFRAAPAYLHYRIFYWSLYATAWAVAVFVAVLALVLAAGWWGLLIAPLLTAVAAVKAAVLYVSTRLDYEMRWYILTDRSLRMREGVWVVRELTLTFANVQNVHVLQGPVQRVFGFSNILLETAGGGAGKKEERLTDSHRALLRGIANPAEVRDLILNLLRRYRSAGLGDREERIGLPVGHAHGWSPGSVELLAEIRDSARSLRLALANSPA